MDAEKHIKDRVLDILGRYKNEFKGLTNGLSAVYKNEWWRVVETPGLSTRYYNSFWEFVEADAPFGCEANKEIIEAICKKADNIEALELFFPEKYMSGKSKHGKIGNGRGSITTSTSMDRGSTYQLNRLKREKPKIAQKVIDGELSANAAYVEAGFSKKKMTVVLDPNKAVEWIHKYFSKDEIEFIKDNL